MKRLLWAALLSAGVHAAALCFAPGKQLQPPVLSGSQTPILVSLAHQSAKKGAAAPLSEKTAPPPQPAPEAKPEPLRPATPAERATSLKKTPPAIPPPPRARVRPPAVKAEPPTAPAAQAEPARQAAAAPTRPAADPAATARAGKSPHSQDGIQAGSPAAAGNILKPAAPLYRRNPPPPYPRIAKARGYQGRTLLNVLVGRDGRVKDAAVAASSGYRLLDEAALKAVVRWIFEPATRGEEPVEMWVKVPIRFQIR